MTKSEFRSLSNVQETKVGAPRYANYYGTFTKMFPIPSSETTVHYLPGNNDVGLNMDPIEVQHARRRFTKHFGPLDQTVVIQNHTLVLLDASRIIEESYRRARKTRQREVSINGTMSFAKSVQPGSFEILCPFRDAPEGLYLAFCSVQVIRHIRSFCLPTYRFSALIVPDAGRYASRERFDGGLVLTTRAPSARMSLRSSWNTSALR